MIPDTSLSVNMILHQCNNHEKPLLAPFSFHGQHYVTQTSHPVQIFKQTNSTSCWTESKSDITIFMDIQIFKDIHKSSNKPDLSIVFINISVYLGKRNKNHNYSEMYKGQVVFGCETKYYENTGTKGNFQYIY